MTVISDTSPLSALAKMGLLEVLRDLYGVVMIPESVRAECLHPNAPPSLVAILSGNSFLQVASDPVILPEAQHVDPGEAAAISLAWQHCSDAFLIIDDRDGRELCDVLGIRKTGTVGVLFEAARSDLVDFDVAMTGLLKTGFRISHAVIETLRSQLPPP